MIYTCIADGIRSPPAFFLKNKYKEPMKMQNENTKRVWLYGQQPDPLCKRPSHEYQNLSPADHQTRRNGKLIYLQQAALHWQGRIFLEELCQKQFALAVWAKTVWPP